MKLKPARKLIWDLETDGLLLKLTRIHIMVVKDADTRQRWVFRRNKREDTIPDGIKLLNAAGVLIGHNIIGFDMEALWKVYGDLFAPTGIIRDTMVLTRMLFADVKEKDFRLWKRGELDGGYIGSHELGAWGQRLGFPKGDYADVAKVEAKAKWAEAKERFGEDNDLWNDFDGDEKEYISWYTWSAWNQDMEDYAIQDVEVTEALWRRIENVPWSLYATKLEHAVHDMMERVQRNGFPFDREGARILEKELRDEHTILSDKAKAHFGSWWVPTKWLKRNESKTYVNPETGEQEKDMPGFRPRPEFGEDDSRQHWGEVVVPKRTMKFKPGPDGTPKQADKEAGCAYTPIKLVDFNPNSRPQIINRLTKIYDWEPQEFTEAGSPVVNDEVLRDLSTTIPICLKLAEIFYYSKRLGQLVDGKNGWLTKCEEWNGDGKIHARTNVGGTVTNRASHSNPNIAQVPRVVFKKLPLLDDKGKPVLDEDGRPKLAEKKSLMKGRAGDHGWDCRNLFYVPDGWIMMGVDQKGIELRCLGHYMAEFDNGEYGRLCVEADPHDLHQEVMELDSRDLAKTFIYAMIYGAQDFKLGCTIDPALAMQPQKAKAVGAEMRRRIMTRIPALGAVVKYVQREAKRGYVEGLDGRHLFVRAKHSALNTKLQGAAATIAKEWCVNFEAYLEEDGLIHGWHGDFVVMAWVHDELQVAVRDTPRNRELCRQAAIDAATDAGKAFNFRLPIDVDVKWGKTWAETH